MTTPEFVVERLIEANDFIPVDVSPLLSSGESISGVPTLTPSNALVSLVNGTVSASGGTINARFLHNGEGMTRVDIAFGTNISGVQKRGYFFINTVTPPGDETVVVPPTQDQAALLDARLDDLEDAFYIVTRYGIVGDGVTDNTTALQNLLDMVPDSAILLFPHGKYKFTHLIVEKPVTFEGRGYWFGHRPVFGSAGWESPFVTEEGGTILQCTATSGIAIDVQFSGYFNLQNLFLKGTGDNTSTVIGVKTPGGDTAEYLNGGGLYYTTDNLWQDVLIGNFKTGARLYTTYTSTYKNIMLIGCDKGMWIGHEDNHIGQNTSVFENIDSMSCNIGMQMDNLGYCTFINTTVQGYYDVGLKLNWVYNCTFIQPYFESLTGNYSIDTDDCASCVFINGNFAGSTNGPTKMRLGANSNNNTLICGSGFNTLILDGYLNEIVRGNASYISGTGVWNFHREVLDVSSTISTIYAQGYTYSAADANRRGGFPLKNGDLILYSPDAALHRLDVANGGGLRVKSKDLLNELSFGMWQAGTYAASLTINAALGDIYELTLTGNVTSSSITNANKGMLLQIILIQDGTGGRTFAWPANTILNTPNISPLPNKRTVIMFRYDGTNWIEIGRDDLGIFNSGVFNATQTIDAKLGDVFELTLTGNVTSSSITNATKGMQLEIHLTQDGTGGRTFAWPANVKLAGGAVTLSGANKRDVITLRYNGTNWYETARALNL